MLEHLDDLAAGLVSLGLLLAYQVHLSLRTRRNPGYTIHSVARRARQEWMAYVMAEDSRAILAIQTLRNSTMAATFFASTAVLLMVGTLNLALHAEEVAHVLHLGGTRQPLESRLWLVKLLLLVLDWFVAFFGFALSVRLFTHVGYLIRAGVGPERSPEELATAQAHLWRAGSCYTVGMRAYYASVPLVMWFFGPPFLLGSTILLVLALSVMDRAPRNRIAPAAALPADGAELNPAPPPSGSRPARRGVRA
jgi:uncharacterized membrane protein